MVVYRNLHKNKFSLRSSLSGPVVGHCDALVLDNVSTRVNAVGRQRAVNDSRRNVHAYVIGDIVGVQGYCVFKDRDIGEVDNADVESMSVGLEIAYNPFKRDTFYYLCNGQPFTNAKRVILTNGKMFLPHVSKLRHDQS